MKHYYYWLLISICLLIFSCKSSRNVTSATDSKSSKTSYSISNVIQTARSYIGTPYKYGGTSKAGMDCSGLVMTSYKASNIDIPRTSSSQSQFGKEIKLIAIKPGDLVFFSAKKNSKSITHVGLVTEIKDKEHVTFIHASTSRGVIEDNIFSDYYSERFVKAIRPY